MAVTRASKLISLTDNTTGGTFLLSTNKIISFETTLSTKARIKYLNQRGQIVTKVVTDSVSTIHTATLSNTLYASQALTLVSGDVIYVMSDRILYIDTLASTYSIVYDAGSEAGVAPIIYEFSTPTAADLNTANGNTVIVTTQPNGTTESASRYINNLNIDVVTGEAVGESPEISFTTKVKTGTGAVTAAGSGYTSLAAAITGGGGSGATGTVTGKAISGVPAAAGTGYAPADTITITGGTAATASIFTVATTKPVSLSTNAAGSSYNVSDTILTAGGTASVHATLTVSHIKVVTAPGIGDDGSGYVTGDTFSVTTGTGTQAIFSVTAVAGDVTAIAIVSAGDYTVRPTLGATVATTTLSGIGTGLTVNLVAADFGVLTTTITTPGSYTVNNTAFTQTSSSGAGTGATFNSVLYGALTLTVDTAGDYSVLPTNPAAQGATTGAGTGATITVSWGILAFTITGAGTGFTSYPTFAVTGTGGTGGLITAGMTVESPMTIDNPGSNLNSAPILTFSATAGTLATATATLDPVAQNISGTTLTVAGNYVKGTDTYPSLAISGGTGCQVIYDDKKGAFTKLQLEETVTTLQTAVNAL